MLVMICRTVFGLKTKPMKHIVIDECQDFSPFQIELLKKTNPAATFTLVGDLYQGIRADGASAAGTNGKARSLTTGRT